MQRGIHRFFGDQKSFERLSFVHAQLFEVCLIRLSPQGGLPPLAEQRRIVAEIEKQFTRLDAANKAVSEAFKRLDKYLSSLLPRLCGLPRDLELDGHATLPPDWKWLKVSDAGEVKLGRQRSPQHHLGEHMRPYLHVANVYEDRIDLRSVLEMNFSPEEYETFHLRDGGCSAR